MAAVWCRNRTRAYIRLNTYVPALSRPIKHIRNNLESQLEDAHRDGAREAQGPRLRLLQGRGVRDGQHSEEARRCGSLEDQAQHKRRTLSEACLVRRVRVAPCMALCWFQSGKRVRCSRPLDATPCRVLVGVLVGALFMISTLRPARTKPLRLGVRAL